MPVYFFHLSSPERYEIDSVGTEYSDIESAYLAAYQTALDISVEMLRERVDARRCSFDIADAQGKILLELPFAEVLHPTERRSPLGKLKDELVEHHRRVKKLHSELKAQHRHSRKLLRETRRLLSGS